VRLALGDPGEQDVRLAVQFDHMHVQIAADLTHPPVLVEIVDHAAAGLPGAERKTCVRLGR
jgi:hypothetical protein